MSVNRIGLALSGGGVRAAAFHLGVLSKLHDLGILPRVDVISTVSGGSITGAFFLLEGGNFPQFKDSMMRALQKSIELRILANPRVLRLVQPGYSRTDIKAEVYERLFFSGKTLAALAKTPQLIINTTNLVTGKNFKLSQDYLGDWKFGYGGLPSVMRIATAVAASTAVPGVFQPIRLDTATYFPNPGIQAKHFVLCDGGVYDNQGTHALTSAFEPDKSAPCTHVICSDASAPFEIRDSQLVREWSVLLRQSDIMMTRIKNLQFQQLIYGHDPLKPRTAYFSIDWTYAGILSRLSRDEPLCEQLGILQDAQALAQELRSPSAPPRVQQLVERMLSTLGLAQKAPPLSDKAAAEVSNIGTRLRALSESEVNLLVHHGASLCELQTRLYLRDILNSAPPTDA